MRCVKCGGPLRPRASSLECSSCPRAYAIRNGIPILTPDEEPVGATGDAIRRLAGRDTSRISEIGRLAARLHRAKPSRVHPLRKRIAEVLLRIVVFFGRPGSLISKARRISDRAAGRNPAEFREVDEAVFGSSSGHGATMAGHALN
jgi:hypothetical protein